MKLTIRNKWLIGIVLGSIAVLLGFGYYTGVLFFSGITPCLPPPGVAMDGMAKGIIYTWIDTNGNGNIDPDEPLLPGVKIKYPPSSEIVSTGNNGNAEVYIFKPGCVCKCWEHEYVEVVIPDGYRSTTVTRKDLTGENLTYEFGFIKIE